MVSGVSAGALWLPPLAVLGGFAGALWSLAFLLGLYGSWTLELAVLGLAG
jgi:hypothetical protein